MYHTLLHVMQPTATVSPHGTKSDAAYRATIVARVKGDARFRDQPVSRRVVVVRSPWPASRVTRPPEHVREERELIRSMHPYLPAWFNDEEHMAEYEIYLYVSWSAAECVSKYHFPYYVS
jgi:hypothetical protein